MEYLVFARVVEYPSTKVEAPTPQKAQEIAEERCGADYERDDNADWGPGYVQDENGNIVLDDRPRIIPGTLYLYERYDDRESYTTKEAEIHTSFAKAYEKLKENVISYMGTEVSFDDLAAGAKNSDDFTLFDVNERMGFAYIGVNVGNGSQWFVIEKKEV